MNLSTKKREWRLKSQKKPVMRNWTVIGGQIVTPVADAAAWQGVSFAPRAELLADQKLSTHSTVFVDFGEHIVGKLHFFITMPDRACDAPVRLRLRFAELPHEAAFPDLSAYQGGLCASWLQEEIITIDNPPELIELPRRYAFRYLRIEVMAAVAPVVFTKLECVVSSSAAVDVVPVTGEFSEIDAVGLRTLRNCMQNVFEDGPKRDRRLWLGDLRLQALVNAVTYKNFDLVERSLYLLASCTTEEGMIPAAVFDRPNPELGSLILDYALLLPSILLEHFRYSGRDEICRELFPLAVHQMSFMRRNFNAQGGFVTPEKIWLFIDWSLVDRASPMTCVYIFALRQLAELANELGLPNEEFATEAQIRTEILRRDKFDPVRQVIVSGEKSEVSWASQSWAILADVLTPAEGQAALSYLESHPESYRPNTPYLWHYVLEACEKCGARELELKIIRDYWGGMVKNGADTFWEAYIPEQPFFSPYNDPLVNSACHAWSCTPSCFLRRLIKQ